MAVSPSEPSAVAPPLLTADAMREADRMTIEDFGIPSFTLMESAGRGIVERMRRAYGPLSEHTIVVVCGKGNNGGDGLVVARQCVAHGARVHVVRTAPPGALSDDASRNHALLEHLQSEVKPNRLTLSDLPDDFSQHGDPLVNADATPTLLVDAMLGTGLTSDLRAPLDRVVAWMNAHPAPSVAVDVPTGLHGDTGEILGDAVRADRTVTMAAEKVGLRVGRGPDVTGTVDVVEIGIPAFAIERVASETGCARRTTDAAVRTWWPERARDAYKYSAGTALVVGGAPTYTGAPVLASQAAARSGAGYVSCACPDTAQSAIAAKLTTIPTLPLPTALDDNVTPGHGGLTALDALKVIENAVARADALLVGPGLGRADGTQRFVRQLVEGTTLPTVIDADGLNALAGRMDALADHADGRWILTPHAGEFQRLAEDVDLADRVGVVQAYAARWNCVLLLKGAPSIVAAPDGRTFVASTGTSALATAGTGDVLAGQCVGLLAQGVPPLEAAAAALHLGGRTAEHYVRDHDARTMQATDLVDRLPRVSRDVVAS